MKDDLGTRFLRFERKGSIAWCTIDRPEAKNALTVAMYFGIRRAIDLVTRDPALHALILTGSGDVFAPGGEMGGRHEDGEIDIGALLGADAVPFNAVRRSAVPVISAVNGLCQGGGLLIAMLSDVAIASDRAVFRVPELLRGVADTYYAAILPAHVGLARARELMFTGRRFGAEEAVSMGVIARCVPHDQLLAEAQQVAEDVLQTAPKARLEYKRIVNQGYGAIDEITFLNSIEQPECREGFAAFVEKRAPAWVPADLRRKGRL